MWGKNLHNWYCLSAFVRVTGFGHLYKRHGINAIYKVFCLYYLSIQIVIVSLYIMYVNKYATSGMYRVSGLASTFFCDLHAYGNNNPL